MTDGWAVLEYEIQMYLGAEALQRANTDKSDEVRWGILRNCLSEVKLLHTRILTQVFLKGGQRDDIKIDQLLPHWSRDNRDLVDSLEEAYSKPLDIGKSPKWYLDKYLAHATKQRGASFIWEPITETMDPPLRAVLKTLPKQRLQALGYFNDDLTAIARRTHDGSL
jgi:hypothetical protein